MDVFICWSGAGSLVMAEGLRKWLPRVIQVSKPFLSSEDIRKGQRWNEQIAGQLAKTNFAILCMTPENLQSEWIHFESGAVSKNPGVAHVCALMLDVKASDLSEPIRQFQSAAPTKQDLWKVICALNAAMPPDRQVKTEDLQWSFDRAWPEFDELIQRARSELVRSAAPAPPQRDARELLEELLVLVRDLHRDRNLDLIGDPNVVYGLGRVPPVLTPEQQVSVLAGSRAYRQNLSLLDFANQSPLPLREASREPTKGD